MGAIESSVQSTFRRMERARRLARHAAELDGRLSLLRRLRARADDGTLATLSETRVEQSWNEQIFAKVLGYRTLFSHDQLPYHLDPKRPARGRRYTDFVLGEFGAGPPVFVASAELKSPGFPLDQKQQGKPYFGATPVEQARATAAKIQGCRWFIVSNYDETRLYRVGVDAPVCTARLFEVRSAIDLADFIAHFDHEALAPSGRGRPGRLERILTMNAQHPGAIVDPAAHEVRLVGRLSVPAPLGESLYDLERALRVGLSQSTAWQHLAGTSLLGGPLVSLSSADGWVAANAASPYGARIARSVVGETMYSVRIPLMKNMTANENGKTYELLALGSLLRHAAYAHKLFTDVYKHHGATLALELLDVGNVGIAEVPTEWLVPGSLSIGYPAGPDLVTSDFAWKPSVSLGVARAIAELLVQFRLQGGGVLVEVQKLIQELDQQLATL